MLLQNLTSGSVEAKPLCTLSWCVWSTLLSRPSPSYHPFHSWFVEINNLVAMRAHRHLWQVFCGSHLRSEWSHTAIRREGALGIEDSQSRQGGPGASWK